MASQIEILNPQPIERLRETYESLPAVIGGVLHQADEELQTRKRQVEQGRDALADALRVAEDSLSGSDDDDDVGAMESLVEELGERLARLDRAIERVRGAEGRHRAAQEDLAVVRLRQAPSAAAQLNGLLNDVRSYRAVGLDDLPAAPHLAGAAGGPSGRRAGCSFPPHISAGTREELEHWASQAIEATNGGWPDLSKLSADERLGVGAIRYYTRYGYIEMNSDRRRGRTNESADVLDWALANLSFLPAYRGICRRRSSTFDGVNSVYVEGSTVSDPSPFSATLDPLQAQHFGSAINYYIKSKRGRNIAYISGFPSEREILFAGNSRFRVLKVKSFQGELSIFLAQL